MNNKIIGIAIVGILFFAFPAAAQLPGDLNCDGYPWEISDLIIAVQILNAGCDAFILNCTYENGDMDGDGIPLTLGDIIPAPFIINGNPNWPDFPRHPESDTIMVESATTHPGEMLTLPLRIKTVDTLVAVQFLLEVDPDYFEFDSMIVYNGFPLTEYNCEGNIYGITNQDHNFPVVLLPGDHHIGDIIISVNPDINQPVTTGLYFSSTPHRALYSGFANSDFFLPVMVDAEIEIIPLTEIESEGEITPSRFEISVYPNPFNNALNISVFSDQPTEISVYDIMGRPVKTFAIAAGNNLVKWNAADESGQDLSAGIYFIGVNKAGNFKKVLYLK